MDTLRHYLRLAERYILPPLVILLALAAIAFAVFIALIN